MRVSKNRYQTSRTDSRRREPGGFTLIELIAVIIILASLAAVAIPRYIELGRDARVAALNAMSGALWSAANSVHLKCSLMPECDLNNYLQYLNISGQNVSVNYGWPEAGETINNGQIDVWVNTSAFTVSLPDGTRHKFSLDGSPDPANCAVIYQQAWLFLERNPVITLLTSGC